MKVKFGTYVGNNTDNRVIACAGVNPDLVFIKAIDAALNAIFSTDKMTVGDSLSFREDLGTFTGGVKSMGTEQFVVGTDARANQNLVNYAFMVIEDNGAGDFATFTYTGDATDGKAISIGFQPDFVAIKGNQNLTGAHTFSSRSSQNRGFQYWAGNARDDLYASLDALGFTVNNGSSSESGANEINTNAVAYHGFALKAVAGYVKVLTYTGDGLLDRTVTGIGFTAGLAWVKSYDTSGLVRLRLPAFSGNNSADIDGTQGTNAIRGLSSDTMTLGTDTKVNGSAKEYHALFIANDFTTGGASGNAGQLLTLFAGA